MSHLRGLRRIAGMVLLDAMPNSDKLSGVTVL
jgi:hypothetical protein